MTPVSMLIQNIEHWPLDFQWYKSLPHILLDFIKPDHIPNSNAVVGYVTTVKTQTQHANTSSEANIIVFLL